MMRRKGLVPLLSVDESEEKEMGRNDGGRVVSPENVLDMSGAFVSPHKEPLSPRPSPYGEDPWQGMGEIRVTIWNKRDQRKLSGNSAPFRKNLAQYCRKHPDWEEYRGQDKPGYVPGGANLAVPHNPRPSPRPIEMRREREPRRSTQSREKRQRTEGYDGLYGAAAASRREKERRQREQEEEEEEEDDEEDEPEVAPKSARREPSKPALRLSDIDMPLMVPSEAGAAAERKESVEKRLAKMRREIEASETNSTPKGDVDTPAEDCQHSSSMQDEWAAAEAKVLEERRERAKAEQALRDARLAKLIEEDEAQQVSSVAVCESRIRRYKCRKITPSTAPSLTTSSV